MKLKRYQAETLAVLRRFLEEARVTGAKTAYEAIAREPDQAARLGRFGGSYKPLAELPDVPYVCLRLPTGGGKTILGTQAIGVARVAWVEKDYPLVLWLVPTKTIRLQTVEALKNTRHAYRMALDEAFGGRVRVFDIGEFTDIRPQDIRDRLCVVVATIQTLRVASTEGRKVYADNENLEPHFATVPATAPGLEKRDGGGVKFSFANLLHVHRPLMIVDEAHNAVTELSREMQARVNPCAIIEFTATPRLDSNILYSVSAQELKDADMVKLPIVLSEHDTWQGAVNGAVARRKALEQPASADSDYIRPIALFQAQPRDREVTVEVLKRHLIDVEHVPEERIAVATGDQRGLDAIDLFDKDCAIEHVITVEALKEGWDCSFAYVFCSVSRIQSAVAVEQLLGRVLRMPYAARRKAPELNRAYAFLSEPTFAQAARGLVDKLVAMGFDEEEARQNIEPEQPELGAEAGLFGPRAAPRPTFTHTVTATPEVLAALESVTQEGVTVRDIGGGKVEIAVTGAVDGGVETRIAESIGARERRGFSEAVAKYHAEVKGRLSPAEQGERFAAPRLMSEVQGTLEFADAEIFMDDHAWSLLDHAPRLSESTFSIRETARTYEIDLNGNHLTYAIAGEEAQLALDVDVEGWTAENLVVWLDRQVRQFYLNPSELLRWLRDLVTDLTVARGMPVPALMRCKYILARAIRERLADIWKLEQNRAYQRYLFAPEAKVAVSFDNGFAFSDGMYDGVKLYRGSWKPNKHFFGGDNVPAFDGAQNGEEFQCAQAIESLPAVKHWLRNVARHDNSFWLPTATGRFYPDFVALLEDGRLLVVEYKGPPQAGPAVEDTNEKRLIGALWEKASGGRGLFLMVEREIDGKDMRVQLAEKVSQK